MTHEQWCAAMDDLAARMKKSSGAERLELMRESLRLAKQAPGLQPDDELEASLNEVKAANQRLSLGPSVLDLLRGGSK